MKVATLLGSTIDEALRVYVNAVSASVCASLTVVAVTGLSLYFVFMAYAVIRGDESNPLGKISKDLVRIGILLTLALTAGAYQSVVIGGADALAGDLSSALSRGDASSPWEAIDKANAGCVVPAGETTCLPYDTVFMHLAEKNKSPLSGLLDFSYFISFIIIALALMVVTLLCVLPLMLASVGLALMLAIGPVFILLGIWPATQRYTQAWLSTAIGFVLTKVLVTAICTLIPSMFERIINFSMKELQIPDASPIGLAMGILIVAIALGFAAMHVSAMGAQLAGGGAGLDSKGVGGMVTQLLLAKTFAKATGDGKDKEKERENTASGKPSLGARLGLAAGRSTSNILSALARKQGK